VAMIVFKYVRDRFLCVYAN